LNQVIEKACACVVQRGRVLVFRHPHSSAGVQLPKGTIEPGEVPAAAVVRELAEESGLNLSAPPKLIAEMKFTGSRNKAFPEKPPTQQRWFIFRFDAVELLPEHWSHTATGSPEEDGLIFDYFWHPLTKAFSKAHPDSDRRFATVIDALLTRP
jgi:8-oxo-dGTP pyrophosphatase MutT (NUDIX family)